MNAPTPYYIEENVAKAFRDALATFLEFPDVFVPADIVELPSDRIEVTCVLGRGIRQKLLGPNDWFWAVRDVRLEFRAVTIRAEDPVQSLTGKKKLGDLIAKIDYALQKSNQLITEANLPGYRIISEIQPEGILQDTDSTRFEDSRVAVYTFKLEMLRSALH